MVIVECRNCGDVFRTVLPLAAVQRIRRCRRCGRLALEARVAEPAEHDDEPQR